MEDSSDSEGNIDYITATYKDLYKRYRNMRI